MLVTSFSITGGEGSATTTDVTTLNGAIRDIDVGGIDAATGTNYTITLTGNVDLTGR